MLAHHFFGIAMHFRSSFFLSLSLLFIGNIGGVGYSQVTVFPYVQNFDSVPPPALPTGWTSTQNRTPGVDDFTTVASSPRSVPNAVLSTNATIEQSLSSPIFDFSGSVPDRIVFSTRRSATHLARVVLEASLDGGATYPVLIGDSLVNSGTTNYVESDFALPTSLAGVPSVRFRWRVVPDISGTTGTFRIDDLGISVRRSHDLATMHLHVAPPFPMEGDSLVCIATVKNLGELTAPAFSIDFFVDANNDSIPQAFELAASLQHAIPLGAAESTMVAASFASWPPARRFLMARVAYGPDQDTTNNHLGVPVTIGYRPRSIVVNEVMYAPSAPEPEWVEVHNTRGDSINLRGWFVSDNVVTSRRIISALPLILSPGSYVVLTRDSTAFVDAHPGLSIRVVNVPNMAALNNTGDAVTLYDERLVVMDSVSYQPMWGGNSGGYSLERIDPAGQSEEQTNWGSSRSPLRSTPGERNSISRKDHDIQVDSIYISPMAPVAGDTVEVAVGARNPGIEAVGSFHVTLFHDVNNDSVAQPSEAIGTIYHASPLPPRDSITFSFQFAAVRAGLLPLIAVAAYAADEDSSNNVRRRVFVVGYKTGAARINEVMYAPSAGIPEWVELVNSSTDTIDLGSWRIGNRSTGSRYAISPSTLLLQPDGYVVVAKDTALLRAAYPGLPDWSIQVTTLPTFLWNNGGDAVVIQDNRGAIIDSLFYQAGWGGVGGSSLERRDLRDPTNDSTNWSTSEDSLRATPGRVNSVIAVDHDLEVMRAIPGTALPGARASLSITVRNSGRLSSSPFTLLLYHDRNRDSVAVQDELIHHADIIQSLARRESLLVLLEWNDPPPGDNASIVLIAYNPDQRPANNQMVTNVRVGYLPRSVVVNEIMFSPLAGNAEYVEVMNISADDVDLGGWSIRDRPTSSGGQNNFSLDTTRRVLHPGELFVLASDSTIFDLFSHLHDHPRLIRVVNSSSLGLNNDGDDVLVRDLIGSTVDSVAYTTGWHNPAVFSQIGRSLERINPSLGANDRRSWSTCAFPAGGTPGRVNSIYTSVLPSAATLSFSPNPFSPDADGVEDFTIIHFETPLVIATMSIKIYDVRGRLIRRLVNNEPGRSRGDIVWDGRDEDHRKVRIGMYIVLLEALNAGGGVLETTKSVVVVAGKL